MREAEYRTQRASSTTRRAFTVLTFAALASAMTACSSGGGGDSGRDDANGGNSAPSGLTFTYPADGQTDVYTQSQVALSFAGDPGDLADDLSLIANPGTEDAESVAVTIGEPESGIYRLRVAGQGDSLERPPLAPQTKYAVSDGDTTLFTFTTRSAPGRPAADGFAVVEYRGDSADPFPFTQLNTVRVTFSEPIDPATAQLGDSVSVTDSSGMTVAGRLNAQGRYLSFDPEAKLVAGETSTVTLDTGDDAIR